MQMSSATVADVREDARRSPGPILPNFLNACCGPKQLSFAPWSWAIGWPLVNDSGIGWPCILASFGLWSKRLEVRRPAGHVEEDDALGLGRRRASGLTTPSRSRPRPRPRASSDDKRDRPDAAAGVAEEGATLEVRDGCRFMLISTGDRLRSRCRSRGPSWARLCPRSGCHVARERVLTLLVIVSCRFRITRPRRSRPPVPRLHVLRELARRRPRASFFAPPGFAAILARGASPAVPSRTFASSGFGFAAVARSKAQAIRAASSVAALGERSGAKARAASTKVGSLSSTSACCGVFDRGRSTVHSSRLGASKASRLGCRNVRCQ